MKAWLVAALCLSGLDAAPRLHLTESKVRALRQQVARPGSAHAQMLERLRALAARDTAAAGNYERAYVATGAAMLARISGEKAWCAKAYRALRESDEVQGAERYTPEEGYGLARATVASGFAYAYDWCTGDWAASERDWVRAKLQASLVAWVAFRHANVEAPHRGSNWVAVCRAGELLALLALGEETRHADRFAQIKEDLRLHMTNFDEYGVSQEGIGYTGYGGIFLLRALLALRAIGDRTLEEEAARHAWWKQAMYSGTFASAGGGRLWMGSGVSANGIGDEGWASLLLAFPPPAERPYFQWWYERHAGLRADLPAERRWDWRREGVVWALLFYDERVREKDPSGHYPAAIAGRHGLLLARNRWRDDDDILVSLAADTAWHSHAWDQPEALQWRLIGFGQSFVVGPEKNRGGRYFSSVTVDGEAVAPKARGTTGRLESFRVEGRQIRATAGGGTQYESLGVTARREMEIDFAADSGATIRLRDTLRAASPREFAWQLNVGDPAGDGGIQVTPWGEAGFRLAGRDGILEAKATGHSALRLGDPVQLLANGTQVSYTVELKFSAQAGQRP